MFWTSPANFVDIPGTVSVIAIGVIPNAGFTVAGMLTFNDAVLVPTRLVPLYVLHINVNVPLVVVGSCAAKSIGGVIVVDVVIPLILCNPSV